MPTNSKCTEEVLSAIADMLSMNISEPDASVAAGITYKTFQKWCRDPEIYDRMSQAKAKGKASLIQALHKSAATGFVIHETRTTILPDNTQTTTFIEKEVPPDHRATMAMLRARFPEEYSHVNRLDAKKVGGLGTGQIDKDVIPSATENPRALLEMVLDGEGKYSLEDDDDDFDNIIDIKALPPSTEKEEFKDEDI